MIGLDIETVPDEDRIGSRQWAEHKAKHKIEDDQDAALHPAFGSVVCICAFDRSDKRILKACGPDEKEVLREFVDFVTPTTVLGGHYIKGFDIPFLGGRILANRLKLPACLKVHGKKPWDIAHIDTVELMKFGGGPRVSLDALCLMLGVPSPKEGEVNGLSVWTAYREGRFEDIATYCGKDVNAWLKCIKVLEDSGVC